MKPHVIVPQIRNLATAELNSARLLDEHVQMGMTQVPQEKLWEWFLQRLNVLEATVSRQSGGK